MDQKRRPNAYKTQVTPNARESANLVSITEGECLGLGGDPKSLEKPSFLTQEQGLFWALG